MYIFVYSETTSVVKYESLKLYWWVELDVATLVLPHKFLFTFLILIGRAKRAPHWGVQSRFRVIYVYIYVYMSVCLVCQINCVGGIT